ncbi:hypothetical protein CRE_23375 [Caenorhabditis remanei]|uniref:Serpentine Receptor, class Z n=1 Tax=Caenorhabditis remanei TaxID=31234 RepID=E3MH66_CAERE|nr:hypothetical protein CRE_23375 [Caenorhabditis remanei]
MNNSLQLSFNCSSKFSDANINQADQTFAPTILHSYVALLTVITPFYIYVFRKNENRDKQTPLFQIPNHFYKTTKFILFAIYTFELAFALTVYKSILTDFCMTIIYLYFSFAFYFLIVITQVNQLLLCMLALQKFAVFFIPSLETHFTLTPKSIKCIRQYSYLSSAQLNQPQRYILWQIVAVVVVKFTYIPLFIFYLGLDINTAVFACNIADLFSTPLIIQLTYLGCNRRNLLTLVHSFKLDNISKIFCCRSARVGVLRDSLNQEASTRY